MELELRSVEQQGAHEAGGAPRGAGASPTLVAAPVSSDVGYKSIRCVSFQK